MVDFKDEDPFESESESDSAAVPSPASVPGSAPRATIIDEALVRKVLETVDAGLTAGLGVPRPGHMCVEAAVSYALGLPHSDKPDCVDPLLRDVKITLNDLSWSNDRARANGLLALAVAQLGSAGHLNPTRFVEGVWQHVFNTALPLVLSQLSDQIEDEFHRKNIAQAAVFLRRGQHLAYASGALAYLMCPLHIDGLGVQIVTCLQTAIDILDDVIRHPPGLPTLEFLTSKAVQGVVAVNKIAKAEIMLSKLREGKLDISLAKPNIDSHLSGFASVLVGLLRQQQIPGTWFLYLTE
jgi:hypothetical protein